MTRARHLFLIVTAVCISLGATTASAQYAFTWEFADQGAVRDFFVLEDFVGTFTNTAAVTDSFEVTLVKEMPAAWQATICEGPVCYPPFITAHTFILGPGASTNLDFAITAVEEAGQGTSIATVRSLSDPGVVATNAFRVISTGLDVLFVDADGSGNEAFHTAALAGAGRTYGVWTRNVMGKLAPAELAAFDTVVWATGQAAGGLDADDRSDLADFVGAGGDLYLNGPDLAYDYGAPASPLYSPAALLWFQTVLGVGIAADNALSTTAAGLPGDPVAAGLNLTVNGGDGAPVNGAPDVLTATPASVVSMNYGTGQPAAVYSVYGEGRTYFSGFGFEGIAGAGARTQMMTAVLDWLTSSVVAVPDDVPSTPGAELRVRPNPFNPQTSILFAIGGSDAAPVEVVVFDIRGRVVRHLFDGPLPPGPQQVIWNGRDDRGRSLGSGVYLARVLIGPEMRSVKMTLAK